MDINIKSKKLIIIAVSIFVLLVAVCVVLLIFGGKEAYRIIQIYRIEGTAEVERDGVGRIEAYAGMMLQSGDTVYTGKDSYLYFKMDEDKYALLEPESVVRMESSGTGTDSQTVFYLETGSLVSRLDHNLSSDSVYEVNTPNSTMAVRGTVFRIEVTYDESGVSYTTVYIFEGTVECQLIFPDGSKDEDIKPAEGGMKIRIRGDDTVSEYILDDGTVDYSELPVEVLEFLRIAIEEGVELPISKEDVDALIAQKTATASELGPCGIDGHTADDGMLHEIGICGVEGHFSCDGLKHGEACVSTASEPASEPSSEPISEPEQSTTPEPEEPEHTHSGGTATCKDNAVCTVCGESYGEKDAANHTGGTEVRDAKDATCAAAGYTGDTYCLGCGGKTADGEEIAMLTTHSGGTATCKDQAVCTVCGEPYGDKDPKNHTGGTEVRDAKDATCAAAGYTGDTYCLGCGGKTADGEEIPMLTTHTGGTEVRDAKDATCCDAGYTGDTYCITCGVTTATGTSIPAAGDHPAAACGASGHHAHDGQVHEAAPCGIEGHCVLDGLDHDIASCLFVTHRECDGQTHDDSCYDTVYGNIEIVVTDNGSDWSFTINGTTYDKSSGNQDGEQYYFFFQARAGDTVTVSRTGTTGEFYAVSELLDQVTGTDSVTFTVTEGAEEYVIMVVIQ